MRNGAKIPPWLARRGFSAHLKRRLNSASSVRKFEPIPDDPKHEVKPQRVGRAFELQEYLTLRMAEVG